MKWRREQLGRAPLDWTDLGEAYYRQRCLGAISVCLDPRGTDVPENRAGELRSGSRWAGKAVRPIG